MITSLFTSSPLLILNKEHPITPPPELVQQWVDNLAPEGMLSFATQAARWGADQELDACCELTRDNDGYDAALGLRAARRPNPPSLKEQAKAELDRLIALIPTDGAIAMAEPIRRALESLHD